MRLKSKYFTLVALIILTATPRAFEQLTDLRDFAQARFRAELRNIFWSFTTPESRRTDARQYSELLARMQQWAPACDSTNEIKAARVNRTTGGFAHTMREAAALKHRQPIAPDEPSAENLVADARAIESGLSEEFPKADESAEAGQREVVLVARNFSDYPLFDETYGPVHVDDAVAQLEWRQRAEPSELPRAQRVLLPKREVSAAAQRFTQKFVQTNFQIRLAEKLGTVLNNTTINSDTLIEIHTAPVPAKPKCSAPVKPAAPEAAPRPLEKPALIS